MKNTKPRIVGVIPTRYKASRLPGKPLVDIGGKPMVVRVCEEASKSKILAELIVATDDLRIKKIVEKFGYQARLTAKDCPSGTDRVAEIAASRAGDIFVNIQGDQPFLPPGLIRQVVKPLLSFSGIKMTTIATRISDQHQLTNPGIVKVVLDKNNFALYFSRSSVPYSTPHASRFTPYYYKHLGIYAYTKDFLALFRQLGPSRLEKIERLEQLRVLENGYRIKVVKTNLDTIAIDTKKDLEKVRKLATDEHG